MATISTRLTNTGTLLVNGTIDEFTGAPVVNSDTFIWLDAAQTASYPGTGTSWTSLTSQANIATLYNGTAFSTSKGGYFTFDGVDDYVQMAPPADIGTSTITTVEIWANIKAMTGMVYGFTSYDVYMAAGGAMGFNTGNSDVYGITPANVSTLGLAGNWKHYCYVMYNNVSLGGTTYNNNKIYVNGVAQPLQQVTGNISSTLRSITGNLIIGGWTNNTTQYKPSMDVSTIKLYDRELTAAEVLQNYNALAGRYGLAANTSGTALQRTTSNTVLAEQFDEVTYNTTSPTIKNLLTYTEQFDNAAWTKTSGLTVTANTVISPANTLTADTITGDGISTGYLERSITYTSGTTYVFSLYAKANTATAINILLYGTNFNSGSTNVGRLFNLSNGTSTTLSGTVNPLGYGIVDCGNGWYRCWIAQTATSTGSSSQQFARMNSLSGSLYMWGYQLEVGTTPTIYQGIVAANTLVSTSTVQKTDYLGNMYVSNIFDEFTGAPVVDSSVVLWIDPGQSSSYAGTGTTVTDLSTSVNNLTLVNSPTFNSTVAGGSFDLNGTNQYGTIPYTSSLAPTAGLSVCCWAYLPNWNITGASYNVRMISKTEAGGYNLAINDTATYYGYVTGAVNISGTYYNPKYALASMSSGWHYIALTCDGRYSILYVDGTARETLDRGSTGTIQYTNNNIFVYGAEAGTVATPVAGGYWTGSLGPAMVYNRALTADEISQNFNALRRRYNI